MAWSRAGRLIMVVGLEDKEMIGTWEIHGLDEASLDRELALANLDASVCLCQGMRDGALPATFHHAKVVMSLAYHGVELFLKYGIRRQNEDPSRFGHDLRKLRDRYQQLYPAPSRNFEIPFIPVYLGFTEDELKQRLREEEPLDQHLRYHLDRGGKPWPGVHGVDPEQYTSELNALQSQLEMISQEIEGQQANKGDGI